MTVRVLMWLGWPVTVWLAWAYLFGDGVPWEWFNAIMPYWLLLSVFFHGYYQVNRAMGWLDWSGSMRTLRRPVCREKAG